MKRDLITEKSTLSIAHRLLVQITIQLHQQSRLETMMTHQGILKNKL
jgi:hypothetical protein